jgi:ankyrin repeat protein
LHFSCQNQSIEMTKFLIDKGSEINVIDTHGNTPLARAVFSSRGRGEVIKLLLDAGADKTKKNNHGISPLDLAKSIANYDIAKFLVE